jgi:hypothetical protein
VGLHQRAEVGDLVGVGDDVVDHQQPRLGEHAHEVGPVAGVGGALGVEEDEVEGLCFERRKRLGGVDRAQVDHAGKLRACKVLGRERRALGPYLQAHDRAADSLDRVGQPQRRVAVRRPDLQHAPRAHPTDEHRQQLRGLGLDVAPARQTVRLRGVVVAPARIELGAQRPPGAPHGARALAAASAGP